MVRTSKLIKEGNMPLFEVAIIETPKKKKQNEEPDQVKLITFDRIIAKDAQTAGFKSVMSNKEKNVDIDRMRVIVRPFE